MSPERIDLFLAGLHCGDERVHGYFRAIRSLYRFLEKRRVITIGSNPVRMMDAPMVSQKQPRPMASEDIRKLLNYPHPDKIKAALMFLAGTGCRLAEARTLTIDSLIETPMGPIALINGKRGQRIIPITYDIYHALMVHLPFPWSTFWLGRLISRAFKAAGVRGSAINLRHSFGTYWDGDELALQRIMGHSKLETTRRYRGIQLEYLVRQYNEHSPILALLRQPARML